MIYFSILEHLNELELQAIRSIPDNGQYPLNAEEMIKYLDMTFGKRNQLQIAQAAVGQNVEGLIAHIQEVKRRLRSENNYRLRRNSIRRLYNLRQNLRQ